MVAAWKFPETLWEVIPKQIFNVDETAVLEEGGGPKLHQ